MNKKKTVTKSKKLVSECLVGQKGLIFLCCILNSTVSVASIVLALLSKSIIDIASGQNNGKLYIYAVLMVATVFLQVLLNAVTSHFKTVCSGKMSIFLRKQIFDGIFKKKYTNINSYHSGELLNRFISDCDVLVNTASGIVPSLCATVAKLVSGTVALLILDWRFAAGLITIGIFIPAAARLLTSNYKNLHKALQTSNGNLKSYFQETLLNLPVIKSFVSLVPVKKKLHNILNENYNLKIKKNKFGIFISSSFYLFFTACYFLVLIWGAYGIQNQTVTYGSLIAFLQIISQLQSPMQSISGFVSQYSGMMASAERIAELENSEDEILPLDRNTVSAIENVFENIKAENLTFSYDGKTVLEDCSFCIERGSIAVITGESGKGKSTLFRLMLGYLNPDCGKLSFNGKYDINASTRSMFSYVPQGNMILSGTIYENLTLCTESTSEDKILSAVETAVLKDWIDTLPDGLNTRIGENGFGVSEGQAQRIAIARALICDTPILLLDEATCSLDRETEHKLLNNLKELPNKTVLLVTHRKVEELNKTVKLSIEGKKIVTY